MNGVPAPSGRKPRSRWWRNLLVATTLLGLVACILYGRSAFHVLTTSWNDADTRIPLPQGQVDDASRLEATDVAQVWRMPISQQDPEGQLSELLKRAQRQGQRVSIAGARHSMGGHTIYPGGLVIDMSPWQHMELDHDRQVLTVGAGARWSDIIPYLDSHGFSVAVMQSDNDFSVGGSISVNCHGWQHGSPPIASTVQAFRIMLANGEVRRCSRYENSRLFTHALGGYGLFGVILDAELRVVPNQSYRLHQTIVPVADFVPVVEKWEQSLSGLEMLYGRLNVDPENLLSQVVVNAYVTDDGDIPPLEPPDNDSIQRDIFRGSEGSDYGKALRWRAESKWLPLLSSEVWSRNQLLNGSAELHENRNEETTDILHEYFIPRAHVASFIVKLREIVVDHQADLLNVTIRDVRTDHDTALRYADQDMIALVMLFVQERSLHGEQGMKLMTSALIDAALNLDGCYYLPYRLHASQQQFATAYPQAGDFFATKRHFDPHELFQNKFYIKYGQSDSR